MDGAGYGVLGASIKRGSSSMISDCCGAKVYKDYEQYRKIPYEDSPNEVHTMFFYVCSKCHKPCQPKEVEDEKDNNLV